MKTKCFVFLSCLAAGALIASPAMGKPAQKSARHSSRQHRMAARTTQVTPTHRYNQGRRSSTGNARYYSGTRYNGARSYAGHRYSSTGYYSGTPRYKANTYYGGSRSYYNGGSYPYYSSYYSGRPYSNWGYGTSWGYYPYSYWGGYPYSSYNNNYYSSYTPRYDYNGSTVAAVQRRLGELGYYHGAVDGVIGPRTRGAIASFEGRNGLVVDARISRPLLASLGLA